MPNPIPFPSNQPSLPPVRSSLCFHGCLLPCSLCNEAVVVTELQDMAFLNNAQHSAILFSAQTKLEFRLIILHQTVCSKLQQSEVL